MLIEKNAILLVVGEEGMGDTEWFREMLHGIGPHL